METGDRKVGDSTVAFCKFPKVFLTDEKYQKLSDGAKILYCALSDRNSLSTANEWRDPNGAVYIYYSNGELCKTLKWSHDKVTKKLRELEAAKLIFRRKQGLGKTDMIYVFLPSSPCKLSAVQNAEKEDNVAQEPCITENEFPASNKTEPSKTECSKTYPSISGYDEDTILSLIKDNIDYEVLTGNPVIREELEEIIALIVDVCCGTSANIFINGNNYPRQKVVNRFLTLDKSHIEYVLYSLSHTTTDIRNIRAYLLATLFNAPTTCRNYWNQHMRHDMS